MPVEQMVVVGAGPAGLAAACQLELYGISPLVFEMDEPGGLLLNAWSVINYPGVPGGISGRKLAGLFPVPERLRRQEVTGVSRERAGSYAIVCSDGTCIAECVIVASGTCPVRIELLEVPADRLFYGVKDIPRGAFRSAAVIGGGDAALDHALALSVSMKVSVYTRNGFGGAVPHLLSTAVNTPSISLHPEGGIPGCFEEDIVVVACGRQPRVGFLHPDLLCSPPEDGSFHLCGDCVNGIYRQASIAAGDGVRAAMRTAEFLRKRNSVR